MQVDFLEGVAERFLQTITLQEKTYGKGKVVYEKETVCTHLSIVKEGSLVAYDLAPNGSENIVFRFPAGSVIGANLLFGDNNTYPFTIYCTEACTILPISKEDVAYLVQDYTFAMRLIENISVHSQGMKKKLGMYVQKSLKENLLGYFRRLAIEQKSNTISLPMSKKQLADYMGVQRPSLFRELKRMKEMGLIDIENRKVTLYEGRQPYE